MSRITTLLIATLLATTNFIGSAKEITYEIAKETADNFLSLDNEWHNTTDAKVQLVEKDGIPAYYIVEYTAGGWAIVSAQSTSTPIIGYNTSGEFASPAPMKELLDFNANLITTRAKDVHLAEHNGWKQIRQHKAAAEHIINTTPDIAPLITINLNQSYPFNMYCPMIDSFSSVTGCVAVGIAQAMMVQGYPPRPYGSHTYISSNTGIISVNYDSEPAYDWDAIYASETTGKYNEIARLLYHIGVSVNMKYGLVDGSGANTEYVADALINNFGYSNKTIHYTSRCPDNDEWLELILNELVHGRAVIYSGTSETIGHCWNIDGWKQSTQMVHCNWGWAGYGNGYFSLTNMSDSYQGVSFLYDHGAIFGIAALTAAPYEIILHNRQFATGTEAGTALTYVETVSADNNATFDYELFGPEGEPTPYRIEENKLTTTETIVDSNKFKYLRIKTTNTHTGESYEKEFHIQIVASHTHKLLGIYDTYANSAFDGYPDQKWQITITADRNEPNKVWLRPICLFSSLLPESVAPSYAIYNEADSTLTMPLGQVLFETTKYKMITAIGTNDGEIVTTGDITLQISQKDTGHTISFASDYVFGVGNVISNKWWYQAIHNIKLIQKAYAPTMPYDIELSNTTFAIGSTINTALSDFNVLCDDKTATFSYELYDLDSMTSPYKIVNNKLVSSEPISDNDKFKFLRIKATNTLTRESLEKEFDIHIVENKSASLEGSYSAYAHSAIPGNHNEGWQITITADKEQPNKVWISPIFLFANFEAKDIAPLYATYDVITETLNLPLGQLVHEQKGSYQFILGATNNAEDIETSGSIELQVTHNEDGTLIQLDPDYIVGIGNAIGNSWWYQGLRHITYSKRTSSEIEINGIYYNINEEAKSAEVTYYGNSYYEHKDEYNGTINIPTTIAINETTYNVTSIGEYAFAKCENLTQITIPASISYIDKYAFASCSKLTTIRVESVNPAIIDKTTFIDVDKSTELIVPIGCIETYKTTEYWNEFTNIKDVSSTADISIYNEIDIHINNGTLNVSGTNDDATVNIYSISGILLHSTTARNIADITLPRGIYIIRVNDSIFKIAI